MPEDYPDQFDEVVDFIQATIKRLRRSPDKQTPIFSRRERNHQNAATNIENSNKKGRRNQKGKNRGCVLTEIHLNVTDLDLGYETKEELIFRYCSGSCDAAETTYDKILKNLTKKKKLVTDKVRQACCRPIAFDDDLSFLDDNLVYHILKKHSAKRNIELFGLEVTLKVTAFQPFCHKQGRLPLDHVAQSPIQSVFKHSQGWDIPSISGKSVPVPHPHSKEFLPNIQPKSTIFQFEVIPPFPITTCNRKKSLFDVPPLTQPPEYQASPEVQAVSPPEGVSSAKRKPFVITHPFSQRFLWQATKGAQLTSSMDPTQLIMPDEA
ncbi:Glial cell line-derived neurotrophic factor [Lonchura striata]|uniref:Glial cell line-derived neurotrophic factor n=1 Tax=Lonchura striata TaxID=40157 RepID=A0A218UVY0_9PASE|nr:Glial cell line-derived neurotrophic factor [Lonchura striata domestica]